MGVEGLGLDGGEESPCVTGLRACCYPDTHTAHTPTHRVWDVEVTLNGVTKTVPIAEGTSLLDAAEGVSA